MSHDSIISFPGLGISEFKVNSVAFTIPGTDIGIAWYAIIITFGMICCIAYAILQAKKIGVTIDDVIDYALFTIPIGVIGARLYYVIFDNEHTYETIIDVFNIRQGGLAIYGGIIAGALTVLAVSYFKKINFFAFGKEDANGQFIIFTKLGKVKIARAMPNTPLLIGKGTTGLCKNDLLSNEEFDTVKAFFASSGYVATVGENDINNVTALTGSSPAYAYLFVKAAVDASHRLGFTNENAIKMFCETLIGSANMILNSDKSIDELIKMVTSPNGTTERALNVFNENDFFAQK